MGATLEIRNLHASINGNPILKGVDLVIQQGESHALMGPNGSGKSTLAYALMGHPAYDIDAGQVIFDGIDVLELAADERSRLGMAAGGH
jgi:Fe-S cluster assembly ATP-binding protein